MALSHKLELRQSQSLVMTPQLLQAIKLLQLSNLDLIAYVEAELERNPLLERGEGEGEPEGNAETPASPEPADDAREGGEGEGEWLASELETDAQAISSKLDADLGNVFPDDPPAAPEGPSPAMDRWAVGASREVGGLDDRTLEAFVAEEKSLAGH